MGNFLPTLTIVMTEIAAVLLVVVGFLWFRLRRLRRLHQAELDTLMGLAGQTRSLRLTPPVTPAEIPAATTAAPALPAIQTRLPEPETEAAPAHEPHAEEHNEDRLAGHIGEALSDIHWTMEHLDGRLDQFRHEHTLLAGQFRKLVEEGNNEVHYTRRDLDRIYQVVRELRKQVGELSGNSRHPAQPAAPQPHAITRERVITPPQAAAPPGPSGIRPSPLPLADRKPAQRLPAATVPAEDTGLLLDLEGITVEEINFSDLDVDNPHGLQDNHTRPSRFDEDRIFFQSSLEDGLDQGWYFNDHGDRPQGPFADRAAATRVMKEMHEQSTRPPGDPDRQAADNS